MWYNWGTVSCSNVPLPWWYLWHIKQRTVTCTSHIRFVGPNGKFLLNIKQFYNCAPHTPSWMNVEYALPTARWQFSSAFASPYVKIWQTHHSWSQDTSSARSDYKAVNYDLCSTPKSMDQYLWDRKLYSVMLAEELHSECWQSQLIYSLVIIDYTLKVQLNFTVYQDFY